MPQITFPSQKREKVISLTAQSVRISPVCFLSLCLCCSRSSHRSLTVLCLRAILCSFCLLHACRLVADKPSDAENMTVVSLYYTLYSQCVKDHFTVTLRIPDLVVVVAAVVLLNTQNLSFLIPNWDLVF